jgi:predicted acetyltransferase
VADHDIRVLDASQTRTAHTLFRGTLHYSAAPDDRWKTVADSYVPGRTFGAFDGERMVGTAQSWACGLAVPGGAEVSSAAVSRVGVRADWTRRGVLSALFREQLAAFREAGEITATLRASEGLIYGRFGYGVATRAMTVKIDRRKVAVHQGAPSNGRVRILDGETAADVVVDLFERIGLTRPGGLTRWPSWWSTNLSGDHNLAEGLKAAVHSGADGDDGYVLYEVERPGHAVGVEGKTVLGVHDLWAANDEAWAALWRFVLRIDLVDEVVGEYRPLDEPVEWLLADPRALATIDIADETWLRLVDVPATLAARTYRAAEPVVIEVRDRFLPDNDGTYRVTPDGAARTDAPADLRLDVDILAATYLGDTTFTALAQAGRVDVLNQSALSRADTLFATAVSPWCGTFF